MNHHTQKSPYSLAAGTGFSENIHSTTMNEIYLTMILENPKCLAFCCELLDRYEELLQQFTPINPRAYEGKEVDAFIALSNIKNTLEFEAQQ